MDNGELALDNCGDDIAMDDDNTEETPVADDTIESESGDVDELDVSGQTIEKVDTDDISEKLQNDVSLTSDDGKKKRKPRPPLRPHLILRDRKAHFKSSGFKAVNSLAYRKVLRIVIPDEEYLSNRWFKYVKNATIFSRTRRDVKKFHGKGKSMLTTNRWLSTCVFENFADTIEFRDKLTKKDICHARVKHYADYLNVNPCEGNSGLGYLHLDGHPIIKSLVFAYGLPEEAVDTDVYTAVPSVYSVTTHDGYEDGQRYAILVFYTTSNAYRVATDDNIVVCGKKLKLFYVKFPKVDQNDPLPTDIQQMLNAIRKGDRLNQRNERNQSMSARGMGPMRGSVFTRGRGRGSPYSGFNGPFGPGPQNFGVPGPQYFGGPRFGNFGGQGFGNFGGQGQGYNGPGPLRYGGGRGFGQQRGFGGAGPRNTGRGGFTGVDFLLAGLNQYAENLMHQDYSGGQGVGRGMLASREPRSLFSGVGQVRGNNVSGQSFGGGNLPMTPDGGPMSLMSAPTRRPVCQLCEKEGHTAKECLRSQMNRATQQTQSQTSRANNFGSQASIFQRNRLTGQQQSIFSTNQNQQPNKGMGNNSGRQSIFSRNSYGGAGLDFSENLYANKSYNTSMRGDNFGGSGGGYNSSGTGGGGYNFSGAGGGGGGGGYNFGGTGGGVFGMSGGANFSGSDGGMGGYGFNSMTGGVRGIRDGSAFQGQFGRQGYSSDNLGGGYY